MPFTVLGETGSLLRAIHINTQCLSIGMKFPNICCLETSQCKNGLVFLKISFLHFETQFWFLGFCSVASPFCESILCIPEGRDWPTLNTGTWMGVGSSTVWRNNSSWVSQGYLGEESSREPLYPENSHHHTVLGGLSFTSTLILVVFLVSDI